MQWIQFLTQKVLLRDLRNDGWEPLLNEVMDFCGKHEVEIPDLNRRYVPSPKLVTVTSNIFVVIFIGISNLFLFKMQFADMLM